MRISDFDYPPVPPELIAQEPASPRDSSRLLVLSRKDGSLEEGVFRDFLKYLNSGDCLVLNDTKVIPARLFARRADSGGKVEILLLKELAENRWEALVRPGKRVLEGTLLDFEGGRLKARTLELKPEGIRVLAFEGAGLKEELKLTGHTPLPPYIKKEVSDPGLYQTVYSRKEGAAAAPTAGLHFTEELLRLTEEKGIRIARVTLHVGLETFRPVKEEEAEDHTIHEEYYELTEEAAGTVNKTRENGGRIVAVGTTSVRVLETQAGEKGIVQAGRGWTRLYVYPGYTFKAVDGMITNFHWPRTTLILLVSAFAGRDNILKAYTYAVENRFRFYSFGDAMLIV